ncbi:MAG: PD40 domain-containing protein [Prevotellaceae bacterium]|nr:PD40 domain-containing protein [Candidatus Colivivens equi]
MEKIKYLVVLLLAVCMIGCSNNHPEVPANYVSNDRVPNIFPEYTEVTIPANIAPMNFAVREVGDNCVARFSCKGRELTYGDGKNVIIDEDEWKDLLAEAKGGEIKVEVFVHEKDGWKAYKPFKMYVAEEDIDPYISYRLIKPSYVAYEMLSMNQRNITNFEEKDIYNNKLVQTEAVGQCVNCHSYRNFKTDNMQFHMRQGFGGTMIVYNNSIKKIDLKTDSTISAGVYPAWHPTEDVIAYSTNKTGQSFHTKDKAKIEVKDTESDLILYDVKTDEVSNISCLKDELEVFPTWDADGNYLYFCSAHWEYLDTISHESEIMHRYNEVLYNLYRKSFNAKTHEFGPVELVYDAASKHRSVSLPRVSPDNKYMLFAEGDFGCFHVWHPHADIYIMDMATQEVRKVENINSSESESYPTWSSNGRWIMFGSRRDDGNFTRAYIAYFDKHGNAHKAFELPQKDPNFYTFQGRSYNRPEFMIEPVLITPQEFAEVAKQEPIHATFKSTKVSSNIDGSTGASIQQINK